MEDQFALLMGFIRSWLRLDGQCTCIFRAPIASFFCVCVFFKLHLEELNLKKNVPVKVFLNGLIVKVIRGYYYVNYVIV